MKRKKKSFTSEDEIYLWGIVVAEARALADKVRCGDITKEQLKKAVDQHGDAEPMIALAIIESEDNG